MRERMREIILKEYPTALIWDYETSKHSSFMRFTAEDNSYIMTATKGLQSFTIFKSERVIR